MTRAGPRMKRMDLGMERSRSHSRLSLRFSLRSPSRLRTHFLIAPRWPRNVCLFIRGLCHRLPWAAHLPRHNSVWYEFFFFLFPRRFNYQKGRRPQRRLESQLSRRVGLSVFCIKAPLSSRTESNSLLF